MFVSIAGDCRAPSGANPRCTAAATLQHFNMLTSVSSAALPSPVTIQCLPLHIILQFVKHFVIIHAIIGIAGLRAVINHCPAHVHCHFEWSPYYRWVHWCFTRILYTGTRCTIMDTNTERGDDELSLDFSPSASASSAMPNPTSPHRIAT